MRSLLIFLAVVLVAAVLGNNDDKPCHDGTCITEHEWSKLDWSWQILRDISIKVDRNATLSIRTKLWETFTNFTAGIDSNWTDSLPDRYDGTLAPPPALPLDFTAVFVQAFHKNRYQTGKIDKSIDEVLENREHDGTRYDKQIILVLEPDDPAVSEAANDLYNKHQSKSAVVVWDEKLGKFTSLKGGFPKLTKYSRVQVVGHGRERQGKMMIGGRTGVELADDIAKLPEVGDHAEIGKISLIGCNIAKTADPDSMPLGDEPFLTEFMNTLKSKHGILTEVSARNTFVQVNAEGRKMVAELTPDGMKWHTKDASKKFILRFDGDGNIVSEKIPATERIPSYPCVDCALGPLDVPTENGVKEIYLMVDDGKKRIATVDHTDMDRVLNQRTEKIFKKSKEELVRDAMIRNEADVVKRFKLEKVADVKTVDFNIVSTDGNFVQIDRQVGKKRFNMELNIGASIQNMYVYEWDVGKVVIRGRKVRVIKNVEEMVREINWMGVNGIRNEGSDNIYRFGDWVISLGKKDFYAKFHGFIASEDSAKAGDIDKVVVGKVIEGKKEWPFKKGERNINLPTVVDDVSYNSLKEELDMDKIRECMNNWYEHTGDTEMIARRTPGYKTALLTFAISISESVRNFRTHIVNSMGLQMLDPKRPGTLTMREFLEKHPMARGGTWPDKTKTGFEVLTEKYEHEVLPKELEFTRLWLLGLRPDESNPHGKVEAIDRSDPTSVSKVDAVDNAQKNEILDSFAIRGFNQIATDNGDGLEDRDISDPSKEQSKRTARRPLGDIDEILDNVGAVQTRKQSIDTKSLSLRTMSAVAADHAYLTAKVAEIVRSKSLPANFKLDEDSVKIVDDEMSFSMVNEENPAEHEVLSGDIDHGELQTHDTLDEMNDHVTEFADSVKRGVGRANKILGVYGIVSGLGGALQAFEDGDLIHGFLDFGQSFYGINDMAGWNKGAKKVAGKAFRNVFKDDIADLKNFVSHELGGQVEESLSRTAGKMGTLMEDVPILGLAFGVYSVVEDLKQHNTLGYIDAGLDITMAGLSLFGPGAEPVVLALTAVRLVIGDFYNEIDKALHELPTDASSLEKFEAFLKGYALALKDVLEQFTFVGQIVGAIKHSRDLNKQYNKDRDFLRGLSDYHNYFKVVKDGNVKVVNFADGSSSWDGGDITFRLYDDGTATLTLEENVDEYGNQRTSTNTVDVGDATGIVAGIGESHDVSFKTETVNFLFFIPVDRKRVISGIHGDRSSLHGTYFGNSKNNQFFTVQHLPDTSKLDYTLGDYFYDLYGMDGNDVFYLGPQKTNVHGGEGSDAYLLQEYGGYTHIDNYAVDMKMDMLVLDSTDFQTLSCERDANDLYISNSGYSHHVKVLNWFLGERYRHLNFLADKGVFFEVRAAAFGIPRLVAIAIDCTKDKSGRNVDTTQSPWRNVITVHGTNFSDTIVGNDQDNRLDGGNGTDTLTGGKGKDMYIVEVYDTGNDVINNCADDKQADTLMTGFQFVSTIGRMDRLDLELKDMKSGRFIQVLDWFKGPECQHMTYLSTDGVAYKASTNNSLGSNVYLTAYLIDKEGMSKGQAVDIASIPQLLTVVTVIGSNYTDTIMGNKLDNYISGGPGDDVVTGGEGADTYLMRSGHGYDTIINLSFDRKLDTLLFGFNFSDVSVVREENDLIVISKGTTHSAKLKDWFKSEFHQHLVIRTIDDVVSVLPKTTNDSLVLTPVVIDKSKSKTGVRIESEKAPWGTIKRLIGSNHSDILTGNDEANYLDPKIGGSILTGGENSDTYIMSVGYSNYNVIDNFATDNKTDILSFEAHYSDMILEDEGSDDLILSCVNHTAVTLSRFKAGPEFQHLFIESGDGVGFTLEAKNGSRLFQPIPHLINRGKSLNHQMIDLRSSWNWTDVNSVMGSSKAANYIQGQDKDNTLVGGSKVDSLKGGAGNDVLRGGNGENFLDGGLGNDTLVGGKDVDWMLGWLGDDLLYGGYGADRIDGGPGSDTVLFSGNPVNRTGVYVDLHYGQGSGSDAEGDIYISVENIYGTPYDDVLIGDDGDNILLGRAGNDVIYPGNGTDLLIGAEGRDVYILGGTTGGKTIQNVANDSAEDTLTLLPILLRQLQIDRYGDHLTLRIGEIYSGYWCPEGEAGPIIIQNWFANETNRHLSIICNDTRLNVTDLDNAAEPFAQPSSMNRFTCSVYDFGLGKSIAIGLVCLVTLVAIIVIIFFAYTGKWRHMSCRKNKAENENLEKLIPVSYSTLQEGETEQI